MKRKVAIIAVIASSLTLLTFGLYAVNADTHTNTNLKKRLAACGSLPNASTTRVVQTTRMFINLPKDIYPNIKLEITPHGARPVYISNAGAYGYALGARGKPNCWSTYFEFDVIPSNSSQSGSLDIGSRSVMRGMPNYLIHIKVVPNPSDVSPMEKGFIQGRVLLGPICPVERIPPDPACAPKPYKTIVEIFATTAVKPLKTVATNISGDFNISLPAGVYVLRVKSGSTYPRCTDVPVKVSAGKLQNVTVDCDTGIR